MRLRDLNDMNIIKDWLKWVLCPHERVTSEVMISPESPDISLCVSCQCMTHTVRVCGVPACGKCHEPKLPEPKEPVEELNPIEDWKKYLEKMQESGLGEMANDVELKHFRVVKLFRQEAYESGKLEGLLMAQMATGADGCQERIQRLIDSCGK